MTKDDSFREGKVYCKLWGRDILVNLFDEEVTLEYAEKCTDAMDAITEELIDSVCRAAKRYCIEWCADTDAEYVAPLHFTVPIHAGTPPREILNCIQPDTLTVPAPKDPASHRGAGPVRRPPCSAPCALNPTEPSAWG